MRLPVTIGQWMKRLFVCRHNHMPMHEGKCFCPDCGEGVVVRWAVLCCSGCDMRRSSRYLFRRLMPSEAYCTRCGEREISVRFLENPLYYQLRHARLVWQDEEDFLLARSHLSDALIRVWFDPERLGLLPASGCA